MNDRIMTLLLGLFLLTALAVYDRYLVNISKKPSPVMYMLKQSGLYKLKDTVLTDEQTMRKKYREDFREKLIKMRKGQQSVMAQRREYLAVRDALLRNEITLTTEAERLIQNYAQQIEANKSHYLKQFSQLDQFERRLEEAIISRSTENRNRIYQEQKKLLLTSLKEMSSDPLLNIPDLAKALSSLDNVFQSVHNKEFECGRPIDCLESNVKKIRSILSIITDAVVQKPQAYLGTALQETRILQQENLILSRNSATIENLVDEINQQMDFNMGQVTDKISELEDADFEELFKNYRIDTEQLDEMFGLLGSNSKRWVEVYKISLSRMESLLPKIINLGPEYGTVSNSCRSYIGNTQDIVNEFILNENTIGNMILSQNKKLNDYFDRLEMYLKGEIEPFFYENEQAMEAEAEIEVSTAVK